MMEEVAEGWQSGRGSSSHVAHYLAPDQSKVSVGNAVSGGLQTGTAAAKSLTDSWVTSVGRQWQHD